MLVKIKETGELKPLVVYDKLYYPVDACKGEWTRDFIDAARRYEEDDNCNPIMSSADYSWWRERIAEHDAFFVYCNENSIEVIAVMCYLSAPDDDVATRYKELLIMARDMASRRDLSGAVRGLIPM